MTPDQLHEIKEDLKSVIQATVNGKIDRMTVKLDEHITDHKADTEKINAHMNAVAPILEEYNERQVRDALLLKTGERIKWSAAVILALGALYTIIRGILRI